MKINERSILNAFVVIFVFIISTSYSMAMNFWIETISSDDPQVNNGNEWDHFNIPKVSDWSGKLKNVPQAGGQSSLEISSRVKGEEDLKIISAKAKGINNLERQLLPRKQIFSEMDENHAHSNHIIVPDIHSKEISHSNNLRTGTRVGNNEKENFINEEDLLRKQTKNMGSEAESNVQGSENYNNEEENVAHKNICLIPADPYRTCFQRAKDPNNNIKKDKIARNRYNLGAQMLYERDDNEQPPSDDPVTKAESFALHPTPLKPYTEPFIDVDEELINVTMHLILLDDDSTTNITCDDKLEIEEILLMFLKQNIGNDDTFSPVCVFNSESASHKELVPGSSATFVEATSLRFELTFAVKMEFIHQIDDPQASLRMLSKLRSGRKGPEGRDLSAGSSNVISNFCGCCSQNVTNDPESESDFCAELGFNLNQCFKKRGSRECTYAERETCCSLISVNSGEENRQICESMGCSNWRDCLVNGNEKPPNLKCSSGSNEEKECCDSIKSKSNKKNKKFCRTMGCNWRDCGRDTSKSISNSPPAVRLLNELSGRRSSSTPTKTNTGNYSAPEIVIHSNFSRQMKMNDNNSSNRKMSLKLPNKKNKRIQLGGKKFHKVIRRHTAFKPEKTRSLLNVTSTDSVAICGVNIYIVETFRNASLTCDKYEEYDCSSNEGVILDPNDEVCYDMDSINPTKPPTISSIEDLDCLSSSSSVTPFFDSECDDCGPVVALSGKDAVLGYNKSVFFFKLKSGGEWEETEEFSIGTSAWMSVAISGDTTIVGASNENDNTGAVYIFERDPVKATWTKQLRIVPSGLYPASYFGFSVSIDGDLMAAGAPDDRFDNKGSLYIYRRIGLNWQFESKLSPGFALQSDFGDYVSVKKNMIAVSDYWYRNAEGTVLLYSYNTETSSWMQQQRFYNEDSDCKNRFGSTIKLTDNEDLLIECWGDVDGAEAAYYYTPSIFGGSYTLKQKIVPSDRGSNQGKFENRHRISVDGNVMAFGGYRGSGNAYIFIKHDGSWKEVLKTGNPGESSHFGMGVAISGNIMAVSSIDNVYSITLEDCSRL